MFNTIFTFEIRRLMQSISTYIYFFILFSVSFLMALLIGGAFKDINLNIGGEKIFANAPLMVDSFISGIDGMIGAIIIVAVTGSAVLKDFKYNTHNLIFTTPISKFQYLFGRYSSSILVCMLILTGPLFGAMAAYATPWVNADKIGAFLLTPYINVYWQTVIPNTILLGAIFFAVSLIARDIFAIWLSLIVLWVSISLSNAFFSSLQYETIAALADPLGSHAKRLISKYWSTYDKNHKLYTMSGLFIWNRIIWLAISAGIFLTGYLSFSFSSAPRQLFSRKPKLSDKNTSPAFGKSTLNRTILPKVQQSFSTSTNMRNLWGLSINECRTLLRNTYFRIILLFGMLFLFLVSMQLGKLFDTTTYPVTYLILDSFGSSFQLFIIILTIVFGGEIVWRARENRMDNILDALPVPNWVFYVSKLTGLLFMQFVLLMVIMVCGILVQLFKGYTHFELLLYLKYLYGFKLIDLWLLAILCVFVHTLSSNKFVGYFIVVLFYAWNTFFASFVLKHNLLIFASDPGVIYSDMNGFGHVIYAFFIFKIYWGAFAVGLAILSNLLWARGTTTKVSLRLIQIGKEDKRRAYTALTIAMLIFAGSGGYIYYNTNVLNDFQTSDQIEALQIKYEQKFKKFEHLPQPKITDVVVNVDLFPMENGLHTQGTYTLQNKSNSSIDSLHIMIPGGMDINKLLLSRQATLVMNDTDIQPYRIYKLSAPLLPGDTITLAFNLDMVTKGFQHNFSGLGTPLYNGTFMNNTSFLPSIGYDKGLELADNNTRKKRNLGYRNTSNAINDTAAYQRNMFIRDADFISFDATVSTVAGQTAVAPGYLQREWTDNGRHYFHYKMDSKILNFYSFLSARYEVKKEKWNDVNLEIYYHKGHEYNLEHMFNGMKKALTYYSANFAPYQHKQVRILEFPRYASFAQSFPNTIPFSEGIGFIAEIDTSSKEDINYPFYVTAHEVAHQWFAHQVIGADVEGSNMLSEAFAEYGAITILEKEIGDDRMRKFIHIDMDQYLSARSNESEKERPLASVDLGQQYIFYKKGSIIMRSLNKYIGEDSVNHALKTFIERYALKGAPYPTTANWLTCLRAVTPDSLQYLVTDGFEKIVIYDNKITDLKSTKTATGYSVDLSVDITKINADGAGKETNVACNDYIEVGVYKDRKSKMDLMRFKFKNGASKITIPVAYKPYKVMLDPRMLLIDKKAEDNEKKSDTDENIVKK